MANNNSDIARKIVEMFNPDMKELGKWDSPMYEQKRKVMELLDELTLEGYTLDELNDAFYKGREQVCLPDEKATRIFLRPTFNGYLRELDGNEDPMENYQKRCQSLINNKDYDFREWEDRYKLMKLQEKLKKSEESGFESPEIREMVESLRDKLDKGESRWTKTYEDADPTSQAEMEGYQWALNDIMTFGK